ncbi:MAG: four helix bundle protein [Bacteroidota bacterium]
MSHNYKQLKVWTVGLDLADQVYDFVADLPKSERFNLIDQTIRSACSVPANIAEGSAKSSDKDFKRYLEMSLGSLYELETHLLIAKRRNYGNQSLLEELLGGIAEEQRMLFGMIKSIASKIN